jgi:hypothetical protein
LISLTSAAQEAHAAAEKAQGNLAGAKAEHDAELAERKAALDERDAALVVLEARWQERREQQDAREQFLSEDGQRAYMLERIEQAMKYADWAAGQIMRIAHLDVNYASVLQDKPSLQQLVDEIEHDRRGADAEPTFEGGLGEREQIEVENKISGTSLARSGPRSMRRVEA